MSLHCSCEGIALCLLGRGNQSTHLKIFLTFEIKLHSQITCFLLKMFFALGFLWNCIIFLKSNLLLGRLFKEHYSWVQKTQVFLLTHLSPPGSSRAGWLNLLDFGFFLLWNENSLSAIFALHFQLKWLYSGMCPCSDTK